MIKNSGSFSSAIGSMQVTSIFGPWEDFIVFILPLILAYLSPDMFSRHADALIHIIIFRAVIQSGHVFLTYFPAQEKKAFSEPRTYIYVLLYFLTFVILNFISPKLFMNVFAITSMFHIINQHMGWYKKSQPGCDFPGKKRLLQFLFFFVTILWICNLFPATPGYIYSIDVTGFMRELWQVSEIQRVVLANICLIAVFYLMFAQKNVIDRPLFFIGTFGWLFYGMLFARENSRYFFILYALFSHGTGYTLYMWKKWPKNLMEGKYEWRNIGKLLLFASCVGFLETRVISYDFLSKQFLAFAWIPSIVHYALDSKIWRTNKTAEKKEGSDLLPSNLEIIETDLLLYQKNHGS